MNRDIYLCRLLSRIFTFRKDDIYSPQVLEQVPDFDVQLMDVLKYYANEFEKHGITLTREKVRSTFYDGISIKETLYFDYHSMQVQTPFELLLIATSVASKYAGSVNGMFSAPLITFAYLPRTIVVSGDHARMFAVTSGLTTTDLKRVIFDFVQANTTSRTDFKEIIIHEYLHAIGYQEEAVLDILSNMTDSERDSLNPLSDIVFDSLGSAFSSFRKEVRVVEDSSSECLRKLENLIASVAACGLPTLHVDSHESGVF